MQQDTSLIQRIAYLEETYPELFNGGGEGGDNTASHEEASRLLSKSLGKAHPADIADALETLTFEVRSVLWRFIPADRYGDILLELSDQVRESMMDITKESDFIEAFSGMSGDDVASLLRTLPSIVRARLIRLSGFAGNDELRSSLSFPPETVGALMDFESVTVPDSLSLEKVQQSLRESDELPSHADKLFVVNDNNHLVGVLPLKFILFNSPSKLVSDVMVSDNIYSYSPMEDISAVARSFEKYDLISAPVVDNHKRIIGRITIDEIVDYIHENQGTDLLSSAGLSEEDTFAPMNERLKSRWLWISVNLVIAIVISQVIALFSETISQAVLLAALMPIVSGMSGNIGNQTATIVIRGIALGNITKTNWVDLLRIELLASLVNGAIWGSVLAIASYILYGQYDLSIILLISILLGFLVSVIGRGGDAVADAAHGR